MFKKDVILPKIPDKADEVTRKFYTEMLQVVKDLRQDVYSSVKEEIIKVETNSMVTLGIHNVWADVLTLPLKKGVWDFNYQFLHEAALSGQASLGVYSGIGLITGNVAPTIYYSLDGFIQLNSGTMSYFYLISSAHRPVRYICKADETIYLKGMAINSVSGAFTNHRAYGDADNKSFFQAKRVTESEDGI